MTKPYEPKVGDWVTLWTGTAHKLATVKLEAVYIWLVTPCGHYLCYDVDSLRLAEPSDRRCKRCEKSEVKRLRALVSHLNIRADNAEGKNDYWAGQVQERDKRIAALEDGLRYYASRMIYVDPYYAQQRLGKSPVLMDGGALARAVLATSTPSYFVCPECGPNATVDEDGCCASCGADTTIQHAPKAGPDDVLIGHDAECLCDTCTAYYAMKEEL